MLRSGVLALFFLHASSLLGGVAISNGSFESPAAPFTIITAPDGFPGWSVTAGNTSTFKATGASKAAAGSQFLFLPAGVVQDSQIEQTISGFVPGVEYEIRYAICGYNAQATVKDCEIEIAAFNHKLDTYTFTVPAMSTDIGSAANPWQRRSFTFPAEGTSTVLAIQNYRSVAATDASAAFDDFTIRVVPKGQPSVALLGKKPRKPVKKKRYALSGVCAGQLPMESITISAGKSVQTLAGASSFAAKVRLKKGRNRITVTVADIAGTASPAATRVIVYKK